jgi:UDP-N-acetylglucosamine:LPS N-acetylglucosamine transferase
LNAEIFAKDSVAEVLEESRVKGDALGSLIDQFLKDAVRMNSPRDRPHALASDTAANRIAEIIEKSCK